jgi:hypothetical protein
VLAPLVAADVLHSLLLNEAELQQHHSQHAAAV